MKKPEPVDEYAETEVLIPSDEPTDRESRALSLYAEYERELEDVLGPRHYSRARR